MPKQWCRKYNGDFILEFPNGTDHFRPFFDKYLDLKTSLAQKTN